MAITQTIEAFGTSDRLPLVGAATAAIITAVLLQSIFRWSSGSPASAFPMFGEEEYGDAEKRRLKYITDAREVYLAGYRKFKDTIFRVTTTHPCEVLILPRKYLEELKKLPDNVLSMKEFIDELLHVKYTKLINENPIMLRCLKLDFTPGLPRLNSTISREVSYALTREIGDCPALTEINVYPKMLRIVAMVSGRVFVGQELSRTEEYIEPAINFTVETFKAIAAIAAIKSWKRPFQAHNLAEIKRIREREEQGMKLLRPIVQARIETQDDPNVPKPDDFLQWSLDRFQKEGQPLDVSLLAKLQLMLSLAAIHTTTMASTNVLYTLATVPDVVAELRQEIRDVVAVHGAYTTLALQQMRKLDSCIRETMRLNGFGVASFERKVIKPFVLSNGQLIPAGVFVQVPLIGVSLDDDIWADAKTFKPLRHYNSDQNLAASDSNQSARNLVVNISPEYLNFGYGRHACPGRFFASQEIKLILANILLRYDIGLVDAIERYPNVEAAGQIMPDPTKTLYFTNAA